MGGKHRGDQAADEADEFSVPERDFQPGRLEPMAVTPSRQVPCPSPHPRLWEATPDTRYKVTMALTQLGSQGLLLFSRSVVSDASRPHGLQHTRPSPSPRVCSHSCPLSQ